MPGGADVAIDPTSTISRMNVSMLYEQYFNAISRKGRDVVREAINNRDIDKMSSKDIEKVFEKVLGLTKLISKDQHSYYLNTDLNGKKEILKEIQDKEFYLYYRVSSDIKAYEVLEAVEGTEYEHPIGKIIAGLNDDGEIKLSKDEIIVAPLYTILLSKIGDDLLTTASPKVNHFGIPIGDNKTGKALSPFSNTPCKMMGETENRLFSSYCAHPELFLAELKDRATAPETHKHIYRTFMDHDTPSNIDRIVDRHEIPYGGDATLNLIRSILNVSGIDTEFIPENKTNYPKQ
jgi:hypothetical protein